MQEDMRKEKMAESTTSAKSRSIAAQSRSQIGVRSIAEAMLQVEEHENQ